jgi:hypothetical protein
MNLNYPPIATVSCELEQTDGNIISKQNFGTVEPIHQPSAVIGLACTGARGDEVPIHRLPAQPQKEWNIRFCRVATREIHGVRFA